MKKNQKILQMHVCTDHYDNDIFMILIFMEEGRVVGINIIEYPRWFKFWDSHYKYYQICWN